LGDLKKMVATTLKEIKEQIEKNTTEEFIIKSVPELLFWELGIEYIGNDTITIKEIKEKVGGMKNG